MFENKDLRSLSQSDMRAIRGRDIAMVFQDPMTSLNPVMKIGKQFTEVLTLRCGLSKSEAQERAVELLHDVGIPEPKQQLSRFPMHLSGGMRQRVAIALAGEPKLHFAQPGNHFGIRSEHSHTRLKDSSALSWRQSI